MRFRLDLMAISRELSGQQPPRKSPRSRDILFEKKFGLVSHCGTGLYKLVLEFSQKRSVTDRRILSW